MEIHIKVLFVEECGEGGGEFVGILNVENEILQAAVRRTKAIVITRIEIKLQSLRESTVADWNITLFH
jgi:hypothetical protein